MSTVEVVHTSKFGFSLNVDGEELFLSFAEYPWFESAKVSTISNVELLHGFHLRWPDLDIDLELNCVRHPEEYPVRFDPVA